MTQDTDASRRLVLLYTLAALCSTPRSARGGGGSTGTPAVPASPSLLPPPSPTSGSVINADPSNYLTRLAALRPGDTLLLAPGSYGIDASGADTADVPGLPVFGLNGTAGLPITITGPESGARPVFFGRDTHNTIRLGNASYIVIRKLEVNGRGKFGFGVATRGPTHDITIEDNFFHGLDGDQQIVAISTTGFPTWNWVIRLNVIDGAGTGLYLGNSSGDSPFVAGLVERNVVRNTIGYNMQVKHQLVWSSTPAGMPTGQTRTVIRHNVFSKSANSSTSANARPNLLVGDCPPSGPGSSNGFVIHGNFFYQNATESLFQGEGNIAFYDNLLVTPGDGVRIQRQNGVVRDVQVFNNTVVAGALGIAVGGGAAGYAQRVVGNAVFAGTMALQLNGATGTDNVVDTQANAPTYLNNPLVSVGALDLFPKVGRLRGTALDLSAFTTLPDYNKDFNGATRDLAFRGAYSGAGSNPGWALALAVKP